MENQELKMTRLELLFSVSLAVVIVGLFVQSKEQAIASLFIIGITTPIFLGVMRKLKEK